MSTKPARASRDRRYRLKKQYGITEAEYNRLLARQKGKCGICRRFRKLNVDHCHATGKVRGLLCSNCNTAIGLLEETQEFFARAVQYIKHHQGES